jgi:anti-sigma B factor antagonist
MEFREQPTEVEGVRLLALDGGLDHTNADDFADRMDRVLEGGARHVVLDLSQCTYVSSWGLGALVRAHHRFHERDGRLAFADLQNAIATVLRISHLDRLFDLYPTVEEALSSFRRADDRDA